MGFISKSCSLLSDVDFSRTTRVKEEYSSAEILRFYTEAGFVTKANKTDMVR